MKTTDLLNYWTTSCLILVSTVLYSQTNCQLIDFESLPVGTISDSIAINNQYLSTYGISFQLEDGTYPHIAQVGPPTTAFGSVAGQDMLINDDYNIGSYFITDDTILAGLSSPPLIISFASPTDSISGLILDVDLGEVFTIEARDQFDSILIQKVIIDGDFNTGDGRATPWGLSTSQKDIYSVRIVPTRQVSGSFGFGFDNFTICNLENTSSIQEDLNQQINIFPNPSYGYWTMDIPHDRSISSLELYDLMGIKIDHEVSLDHHRAYLKSSYSGTVIIRLVIDEYIIVKKIVLE